MPELRTDPIVGRWVIIATDRAKRPVAPKAEPQPAAGEAADDLAARLASLNADPPAPEEDATEPDLDALLASLK